MAEKLTKQQELAVNDRGGDLLVSAAAGSGKTKVLVERLMQYITDPADPANIDDFLIITYTKAAATELRGKIAKALTQRIADDPTNMRLQHQFQRLYLAKISTVHSFCGDILREYAYMLELSGDFRMIEEQEDLPLRYDVLDRLLAEAYDTIGNDKDLMTFVDTQGIGRNDQQLPELILKVYDSAKCHMDSDGWLDQCLTDADTAGITDAAQTIWGRYLMDNLFRAIDLHLSALDKATALCTGADGLEKMVDILVSLSAQLKTLRAATSWDQIYAHKEIDAGSIKGIGNRKNVDKETYAMAKVIRDHCAKDMENLLRDFANDSACVLADLSAILPAVRGLIGLVREFGSRYDRIKKSLHVMDFSDLEHKALDLLLGKTRQGPTAIARQIGSRYRQILVDEYQDSNEVQDAIFAALTKDRGNLFMVGDVKQSIYQFRLADPGIFLDKYARFGSALAAKPGEGRKIVLSNNFRSGPEVIEAVNSVFRSCMSPRIGGLHYGDDEALWEGVPKDKLPDTAVSLHLIDVESDTYAEEAEYVAQQIELLLDGSHLVRGEEGLRPVKPEDIAILLRSPKTSGWDFHYALQKRGIQTVSSHSIDLLSTDEVEWLRSLLQAINNPRQDIPLIAAITGPVFGFTANDLAAVRAGKRGCCFYDALCNSGDPKAKDFLSVLSRLRQAERMYSLPQLIESIFTITRADTIYSAMSDGSIRCANLREFYQFVVRYSSAAGADLRQLLDYLQQSEQKGLSVNRQGAAAGCVQITSIHKSKGLEYPVVFLCGLSRLFNMRSTNGTLLCDPQLGLGLSCVENSTRIRYPSISNNAISRKLREDSISEELRVLYVAMTRPKDRLYMTFAQSKLAPKLTDLSVRLDLCPPEMITSGANCLGTWVLYTAMQRTEAGQLFAVSRKPDASHVSSIPWDIRYFESRSIETDEPLETEVSQEQIDPAMISDLKASLAFTYAHQSATTIPSKQTATQLKGRFKDREVKENTSDPKPAALQWRQPDLAGLSNRGKEKGSAMHAVLQYLDFSDCSSAAAISAQINALTHKGLITAQQAQWVSAEKLAVLFSSEMGRRLASAKHLLREFKFSILEDASKFTAGAEGEQILLQGVVDCAMIEPDGITVIDFKTDRVTLQNIDLTVAHYTPQVQIYADALSRIYSLPIKQKSLYFFAIDTLVDL